MTGPSAVPSHAAVVVMGVCGCGKTSVGKALASTLTAITPHRPWVFLDGDDYHPAENVAKMSAGQPLSDADREPWLDRLADLIAVACENDHPVVLACSALRRRYRDRLRAGASTAREGVRFIHLAPDRAVLERRMSKRRDHFMKPGMLESQLATLEPPPEHGPDAAITIREDASVQEVVALIALALSKPGSGS